MSSCRWITHKARSEQGASLSMALLVFLVCTVVSSIAISAATAVSGRQSQLEEMERSYYNVTSATRVFWDEMAKGPEDSDGLVVSIERGCNVEQSAGEWDGWYMVIDSTLGTDTNPIRQDSATLFEIASYDLVMNNNGSLSFGSRESDSETVAASFDTSESVPKPKLVSAAKAAYTPFNFKAKQGSIELNDVTVTVVRNDDQTFEFEFREEGDLSYVCTLTALVWAEGGTLGRNNETNRLEGTTKVYWKPINMTVGTVGDAS
ncbi:MAG: hypothetical protein Q4A07_00885 [Coriobacteriales bacterium]|nr:hypothetical protein [Coriobacteriales bacterium]